MQLLQAYVCLVVAVEIADCDSAIELQGQACAVCASYGMTQTRNDTIEYCNRFEFVEAMSTPSASARLSASSHKNS